MPPGSRTWRIGLVTAQFNPEITRAMRQAALERARALRLRVVEAEVPGAYDLPLMVQTLLRRPDVDAVAALGAIITGDTGHDELIAAACAHALTGLALATGKPVGLGVTGPRQTEDQARARIDRAPAAIDSIMKQLQTLASLRTADDGRRRAQVARVRHRERRPRGRGP